MARQAIDYVLSVQKDNGAWYYSYNPENDTERKQIDFHQGFVLMSLHNYAINAKDSDEKIKLAIAKGLDFYAKEQFFDNGKSKWRLPKEWPVEIHNQAQGIITFIELSNYNTKYKDLANEIAAYTIQNMQHKKGYFYYQIHKRYSIKISYIRWSQAWMLLALATIKNSNNEE